MAWTTTTTRATGFLVTAAVWNAELVDNMQHLEPIFYGEFTSTVNVTSTNSAAPDTIISSGSQTYANIPYWFEFYCPSVNGIASVISFLQLVDGTTEIHRVSSEARVTGALTYLSWFRFRYTPSAGSHTFLIAGYNNSAGTCAYQAGAGGGATVNGPGYLHIVPAVP